MKKGRGGLRSSSDNWRKILNESGGKRLVGGAGKSHWLRRTDKARTVTTRFLWRETSDIWADLISALSFLRLAVVVVCSAPLCRAFSVYLLGCIAAPNSPSFSSFRLSHVHVESSRVRICSKRIYSVS